MSSTILNHIRSTHLLSHLFLWLMTMVILPVPNLVTGVTWTTPYTDPGGSLGCIDIEGDDTGDILYMSGNSGGLLFYKMVANTSGNIGGAASSALGMGIGYPNLYFGKSSALYVRTPTQAATLMTLGGPINTPKEITFDNTTNILYFTTTSFTPNGIYSVNLGNGNAVAQIDDGSVSFTSLRDIRVFGSDLYFASPGNNAVYKVPQTGGSPTIVCDTMTAPNHIFLYNNKLWIFSIGTLGTISSIPLPGGSGISTTILDSAIPTTWHYMHINSHTGDLYVWNQGTKQLQKTFLETPISMGGVVPSFNISCVASTLVAITGSTNCTITPAMAPTKTTYVNMTFILSGSGSAATVTPSSLVWLTGNVMALPFLYHTGRLEGVDELNFTTNSVEMNPPAAVSFTVTSPVLSPFHLVCTTSTVSVVSGSVNCTITPTITPTMFTFINISFIQSGSGAAATAMPMNLLWSIGDSSSRHFTYRAGWNAGVDQLNFTTNSDELYAPDTLTINIISQPINIVCGSYTVSVVGNVTCSITPSIAPSVTTTININSLLTGSGPAASVIPTTLIWSAGDASSYSFIYQAGRYPGLDEFSFSVTSLQLSTPNPVSFTITPAPIPNLNCVPTLVTLHDGETSTCSITPPITTNSLTIDLVLNGPGFLSTSQLIFDGTTSSLYFIYTSFLGTGGQSITITASIVGGIDQTTFVSPPVATFTLIKTPCGPGNYADTTSGLCIPCDYGAYSSTTGATSCTLCSAGRFNPTLGGTGSYVCQDCAAGNFSATVGASVCTQCGIGQYSDIGRTGCQRCSAGTYQSDVGQSTCLLCPSGRYGSVTGGTSNLTSCIACPLLSPVSQPGSTTWSDCQASLCPNGLFTDITQPGQCQTPCPVGEFCVDGQTIPCPSGTFNPDTGSSNVTSCQLCPTGTYNQVSGAPRCLPCGPGTFSTTEGSRFCTSCPPNTYSPSVGAMSSSTCLSCPPETPASLAGSPSVDYCTNPSCVDGFYTPMYTQPCAALCLSGYKCLNGALIPCPAGTYSHGSGNTACSECGAGYFSLGTTKLRRSNATCLPCPISTWSSSTTSPYCSPCGDGYTTLQLGSTSSLDCVAASSISRAVATPVASMATVRIASDVSGIQLLIPLAGTEVLDLSVVLPDGRQLMFDYQQSVERLYASINNASAIDSSLVVSTASLDAVKATARGMYLLLRHPSESLRSASGFCCDTSDSIIGTETQTTNLSSGSGGTQLSDTGRLAMILTLIFIALISLGIYRYIPARVASTLDLFNIGHFVSLGHSPTKQPTQYGAGFSMVFLSMAIMLAVFLGAATNEVTNSSLQPPSATPEFGTATSAFQFTLRAFAGSINLTQWCPTITDPRITHPLASLPVGFQAADPTAASAILFTSKPVGQHCAISAVCASCSIRGTSASLSFTFPYNAQLIEWETGVSGAQPSSSNRFYGVMSQLPNDLLDAHGQLSFSAIESFYVDRSNGKESTGFEIEFNEYSMLQPQLASQFNSLSTIQLSFQFDKSPLAFVTTHDTKLSVSQMLTMILSAIVSLFSVFMIAFRLSERWILKKMLKFNTGRVIDVSKPDIKNMNKPVLVIEEDYREGKTNSVAPLDHRTCEVSNLPSPSGLTSPTGVRATFNHSDDRSNHHSRSKSYEVQINLPTPRTSVPVHVHTDGSRVHQPISSPSNSWMNETRIPILNTVAASLHLPNRTNDPNENRLVEVTRPPPAYHAQTSSIDSDTGATSGPTTTDIDRPFTDTMANIHDTGISTVSGSDDIVEVTSKTSPDTGANILVSIKSTMIGETDLCEDQVQQLNPTLTSSTLTGLISPNTTLTNGSGIGSGHQRNPSSKSLTASQTRQQIIEMGKSKANK